MNKDDEDMPSRINIRNTKHISANLSIEHCSNEIKIINIESKDDLEDVKDVITLQGAYNIVRENLDISAEDHMKQVGHMLLVKTGIINNMDEVFDDEGDAKLNANELFEIDKKIRGGNVRDLLDGIMKCIEQHHRYEFIKNYIDKKTTQYFNITYDNNEKYALMHSLRIIEIMNIIYFSHITMVKSDNPHIKEDISNLYKVNKINILHVLTNKIFVFTVKDNPDYIDIPF